AHPASTRRHDSTWIAYVRNTTSADRAIHPGRGASDTCSERNSPQFLTIAPQTIRATTLATASCRAHQSHLRTVGTAVLRRDLAVQGLEALRDDGEIGRASCRERVFIAGVGARVIEDLAESGCVSSL